MSYQAYRTHPQDAETWVDRLSRALHNSGFLGIALAGGAWYLIGLGIAASVHFAATYVETPATYIFVGGAVLAAQLVRWAWRAIHPIFEEMRPIFLISDAEYSAGLRKWLVRTADWRKSLASGGFIYVCYFIAVVFALYDDTALRAVDIGSLRPAIFLPGWYTPQGMAVKMLLLWWIGLPGSLLAGTGIRMVVLGWLFWWDERGWPVIPLVSVIRTRMRGVADFYIKASVGWFLGVGLLAFTFNGHLDAFSWILLGGLFGLGLLWVTVPQVIFRRFLLQSYEAACTWALDEFNRMRGVDLTEAQTRPSWEGLVSDQHELYTLPELVAMTAKPRLWVYDSADLSLLALGQSIAIISIIVQVLISRR
jgi:hypothetical protein